MKKVVLKKYTAFMHHNTSESPVARSYRGMLILTDPSSSKRSSAVFPLFREPFYLVKHLKVPKDGLVLDLCTGSGIVALFAARKAGRVIATDINPRALAMARFNARMNGIDKKVEFRQGDLFQPIEGMLFDLIVTNPPVEYTEYILRNVYKYLHPNGSLQIICYIPDEDLYLLDSLKERFRKVKIVRPHYKAKNKLGERSDKDRTLEDTYEHMNHLFIHAFGKKPNS